MTQRQVLLHYEAAVRLRKQQRAESMTDSNFAFAGGTEATDHLKQLITP